MRAVKLCAGAAAVTGAVSLGVWTSSSATFSCRPRAITTCPASSEIAASKAASPALVGSGASPARSTIRSCAAASISMRMPPSAHKDHSREIVRPERLPSRRRASRQPANESRNRLAKA
ncbi:hypothetical protein GCM10027199_37430 [Amycolatopsis magusensis]